VGQEALEPELAPDALVGSTTARANRKRTNHFFIVICLTVKFSTDYHAIELQESPDLASA
jgi:hypothetical protein